MARTWNGLDVQARVHRAAGRAIVAVGVAAAVQTKVICHVVTGTLSRSIHVSPLMANHDGDQESAHSGADLLSSSFSLVATPTPYGPAVEVGSWVDYACVEWVGRRHVGLTEGLGAVRGIQTEKIVRQAFREEGLR